MSKKKLHRGYQEDAYIIVFFIDFIREFNFPNISQVDQIPNHHKQVQAQINYDSIITQFMSIFHNADQLINSILGYSSTDGAQSKELETYKSLVNGLSDQDEPHPDSLPKLEQFIQEIGSPQLICDQSLFSHGHLDDSLLLFPPNTNTQENIKPSTLQIIQRHTSTTNRREKNSNAIKKIGRIILDNLRQYTSIRGNSSVMAMMKLLSKDSKVGRNEINKRDKFNTFHLRVLLSGRDLQLVRANLRITRRLLSDHLRQNVLQSRQITSTNKLLYLNTMKCSALRCLHQSLAVRLQMSQ